MYNPSYALQQRLDKPVIVNQEHVPKVEITCVRCGLVSEYIGTTPLIIRHEGYCHYLSDAMKTMKA